MAHDHYLGSFNKAQFDRFAAFARSQLPNVEARINHLEFEKSRIGQLVFVYEDGRGGKPVSYQATPANSYIAKLLSVYEVLGGNAFIDLRIRLRGNPVYAVGGDETTTSKVMSNGESIGLKGMGDAPTSELMIAAQGWLRDSLGYRFNRIERKIRIAVDYYDQLDLDVQELKLMQQAATD